MRIGHPRRPPVPPSFRDAFADYVSRSHEKVIELPPASTSSALRRISKRAGLILDRPRLLELERTTKIATTTKLEILAVLAEPY